MLVPLGAWIHTLPLRFVVSDLIEFNALVDQLIPDALCETSDGPVAQVGCIWILPCPGGKSTSSWGLLDLLSGTSTTTHLFSKDIF